MWLPALRICALLSLRGRVARPAVLDLSWSVALLLVDVAGVAVTDAAVGERRSTRWLQRQMVSVAGGGGATGVASVCDRFDITAICDESSVWEPVPGGCSALREKGVCERSSDWLHLIFYRAFPKYVPRRRSRLGWCRAEAFALMRYIVFQIMCDNDIRWHHSKLVADCQVVASSWRRNWLAQLVPMPWLACVTEPCSLP